MQVGFSEELCIISFMKVDLTLYNYALFMWSTCDLKTQTW